LKPLFFATPDEFGAWLERNHESESELLVGFHKKATGKPSITWAESVVQALRFGWIDGIRRGLGEGSYTIRFTPRKPSSNWSTKNVETAERLKAEGLMAPAGLRAYEARRADRTGVYSFERREAAELPPDFEKRFKSSRKAWQWFSSRPPGYRRTATHWVVSAKRDETRLRRLETLIECCSEERKIPLLAR
jgi:uncharacterized protein YdeI (YjbR/CyaY-like superfamily)